MFETGRLYPVTRSISLWLAAGSLGSFGVSLCLPALLFRAHPAFDGWVLFLMGWLGIVGLNFGWFANLVMLGAWIAFAAQSRFVARILSVVAVLVAADSVRLIGTYVPLDEANVNKAVVSGLGLGFYLWIGAMALLFVASLPRPAGDGSSKVESCSPASKP